MARTDTTPHAMTSLARQLVDAGVAAGLTAVGITTAEPFHETRLTLEERKAAGLHGGMAFTYRNPARSTDPGRALAGARSIVVGALGYLRDPPAGATDATPLATVARYSWEDHYEPLRRILGAIAQRLEAEGWRAKVLVDDNALVDRAAAHRAGIGWFGKNTNLLLPGHGSWFVLGSVVSDAPLPPTSFAEADLTTDAGCGTCTRCLPACPTGALVAPGVLDARRCLAWLLEAPGVFPREHRIALGGRIYGCDDCQEVCPPNRLEERRSRPAGAGPAAEPWVDLLAMLAMTDEELIAHFRRWYIAGRDPAVLRRNALIALANIADPDDPRVLAAVDNAARDRSPLVRAHAAWAAARLGYADVVDALERSEADPMVRDEVGERPPPRTR